MLTEFRPDQRIHLGQVAAEPEEPAGGSGQHQGAANQILVGTVGSHHGQTNTNPRPNGCEEQHRKEGCTHLQCNDNSSDYSCNEKEIGFGNEIQINFDHSVQSN